MMRELQLQYKDERERMTIVELHQKAQEVINTVNNDYTMELLRNHYSMSALPLKLSQLSSASTGGTHHQLKLINDALLTSLDPNGPVQSFYPVTPEEQQKLECAVECAREATDGPTAHNAILLWLQMMKGFAHTVAHRWECVRLRDAAAELTVMKELQKVLALPVLRQLLLEQQPTQGKAWPTTKGSDENWGDGLSQSGSEQPGSSQLD